METSYFAKYKGKFGINIALKKPYWFYGPDYPLLFPKRSFLSQYQTNKDEEKYRSEYFRQVLNNLNPQKVYADLRDKVLLCYEKSGTFCHRRIVAEWIENELGILVPEI